MRGLRIITAAGWVLCALSGSGCSDARPASGEANEAAPAVAEKSSTSDRIAVAMSGAPESISKDATILDFDSSGKLVQLRAGTNGWVCLADDTPAAPGDSPDCLDERWQAFFEAYEQKKAPRITGIGMAYMLGGSLTPSNTDPFAEKPAPGSDWMKDGPHVMVILPDPKVLDAFPSDHTSSGPYVMYKGTPYAHLMVPVSAH